MTMEYIEVLEDVLVTLRGPPVWKSVFYQHQRYISCKPSYDSDRTPSPAEVVTSA